jgi:hypothetical protein
MKTWILKAIIQKQISFLPFSNKINYIFQKYVTKGVYLTDEYFYDRLDHAKIHLNAFYSNSEKQQLTVCLELGTGWYPIVPISFFLSGVQKTYSVDISMLTSIDRIFTTIDKFKEAYENGQLHKFLPQLDEAKYEQLITLRNNTSIELPELLLSLHIQYLIGDARKLNLPDNSIDLINSNNTFEHINPVVLEGILSEFKRVCNKQTGIMSHFIDMSDHFAHFDKSISIYNFLKFSDRQWKLIDNSIQPQNRWRIYDYKELYQKLRIPIQHVECRPGDIQEVQSANIHPKFKIHSIGEVAISHCHFISSFNS